jgi:hypothetical protein
VQDQAGSLKQPNEDDMNRHAKGFIGVVIGVSCSVQAVTRTWLSSTGGVWTSTANWSDSTIPGSGDTADLSAVTGAVDVTENIAVGAILYNPAFSGTTNTLTLLSDTAAPGSRSISLTTAAPSQIQVGEGAQLLIDADLTPTVDGSRTGAAPGDHKRGWRRLRGLSAVVQAVW